MPLQRQKSRQLALQILYQNEFHEAPSESQLKRSILRFSENKEYTDKNLTLEEQNYCLQLLTDFYKNQKDIDDQISSHSENWRKDRMSLIDLNIMRIAALEILHYTNIPPKVSINEALVLSKNFGEQQSTSFINGILDRILKSKPKPKS